MNVLTDVLSVLELKVWLSARSEPQTASERIGYIENEPGGGNRPGKPESVTRG